MDNFLTINQLGKICNVSRAGILRMEQEGLLKPCKINEENGYRYYDNNNVVQLLNIQSLQKLGITHKEMQDCYASEDGYSKMLEILETRLSLMEAYMAEIKLRLDRNNHLRVSDFRFPETLCYCKMISGVTDISLVRPFYRDTFREAVAKGYQIDQRIQPFIEMYAGDFLEGNFENVKNDYLACIPVIAKEDDPNVTKKRGATTMSVLLYGGASDMKQAFTTLGDNLRRHGCEHVKYARILGIFSEFKEDTDVHTIERICVPINEKTFCCKTN